MTALITPATGLRAQVLAYAIADEEARSLIEDRCDFESIDPRAYNVSRPNYTFDDRVKRAVDYLDLRADVLPYRYIREGDVVRFEARERK